MQALPANCHFIDALELRPVTMLRSVPDMLASYLDMLAAEPLSPVCGSTSPYRPHSPRWTTAPARTS